MKSVIRFGLIFLFFGLCLTVSYFVYFKNVVIYEAVEIEFIGITANESSSIAVTGISPLGKKTMFYQTDHYPWQNQKHLKNIVFTFPDSLLNKIKCILITIGNKTHKLSISDLTPYNSSLAKGYALPYHVKSKKNFFLKLMSVFPVQNTVSVIQLLLLMAFAIAIIFLIIKRRNVDTGNLWRKMPGWLKYTFFSILTACYIFFGYLLFRYTMASYITTILLIIFCCTCLWLLVKLAGTVFKTPERIIHLLHRMIYIFAILWFCAESLLRILGINLSYNEQRGLFYSTGFQRREHMSRENPYVFVYPKNYTYTKKTKEFTYTIEANNEGLRDINHPVEKEKDEYRIICLGNSFTEGSGAPQDSTWPILLEQKLKKLTTKNITVFNAGKTGHDPFFEYMLLKEEMLKYKPDLVLVALGSSDHEFYRFRGGFERFTPDGIKYREGPAWEKLYASSYIVRAIASEILHYKYFLSPAQYKTDSLNAINAIYGCIGQFHLLSAKEKFKLVFIFFDDGKDRYFSLMQTIKQEKRVTVFDLFEYNKNIEEIDKSTRQKYFWPIDGHCNSKGYDLIARGVEWNLINSGIIDSLILK